jgi:hypothetical protein
MTSRNNNPSSSNSPGPQVRGHNVVLKPARPVFRLLSGAADVGMGLGLLAIYAASSGALEKLPLPWSRWAGIALLAWIVPWIVLRVLFGRSVGEAFWGLRARPGARRPFAIRTLQQSPRFDGKKAAIASFLTAVLLASGALGLSRAFARHPLLVPATELSLEPSLPIRQGAEGISAENWRVLPFFYTLGSWPVAYDGRPVLYSIPYEKGPPRHFVGRVHAKWGDSLKTRLTLEGPKTPQGAGSREEIHSCVAGSRAGTAPCLFTRDRTLSRHGREMQGLKPARWEIKWFRVENAALGSESETQGVFLRAESQAHGQDRYLLINSSGVQQAIYLEYPMEEAARARGVLETAIRSLRSASQVTEGRLWIDKELSNVRMDPSERDKMSARRLTNLQSLLVAKLSVDPSVFDAYFHLAGTAILMLRRGAGTAPAVSEEAATLDWLRQSSYTQRQLIGSLRLFARDLEAAGQAGTEERKARIRELEAFALEAAKY